MMSVAAINWFSKKQLDVALYITEAEYVVLSANIQEAAWLRILLSGIKAPPQTSKAIKEDNQLAVARNSVSHNIDIKFLQHMRCLGRCIIDLIFCPTKLITADIPYGMKIYYGI